MTTEQEKDDAQWLDALAGQAAPGTDPVTHQQADALRRALQAQSTRKDRFVPEADDAHYQQLLFRLRQEGLSGPRSAWEKIEEKGRDQERVAFSRKDEKVSFSRKQEKAAARTMTSNRSWVWGIAATVLVVGVAWVQLSPQGSGEADMRQILRGQGTVLIVTDPAARAAELVAGLKAVGVEPAQVAAADGPVQLKFAASAAALDYLNTQRIEPQAVEGVVTLTLTKPQKKPE